MRGACGMLLSVVIVAGCQKSDLAPTVAQLERQNADLEQAVRRIASDNAELKRVVHELAQADGRTERGLAELATKWEHFETAFDPEKRQALEKNAKAVAGLLAALQAAKTDSDEILKSLQKTAEECGKIQALCQQHAREANDANLVGKLQESVDAMGKQVAGVKSIDGRITSIKSEVQQIKSEVQRVESKTRHVEGQLSSLRSRVR